MRGEWLGTRALLEALDLLFSESFEPRNWPAGKSDWNSWAVRGGYPGVLALESAEARDIWFEGYVSTYLERDLRQLSDIAHLPDFQRLMKLTASRCGRLVNQSDFGREVHLPLATTHRYLNLLEAGCQISRLPNYRTSASSSAAKARKVFWTDCGRGEICNDDHRSRLQWTACLPIGICQVRAKASARCLALSGGILLVVQRASLRLAPAPFCPGTISMNGFREKPTTDAGKSDSSTEFLS